MTKLDEFSFHIISELDRRGFGQQQQVGRRGLKESLLVHSWSLLYVAANLQLASFPGPFSPPKDVYTFDAVSATITQGSFSISGGS